MKTFLVDDDELTLYLHKLFIQENTFSNDIHSFENGKLALDYLNSIGEIKEDICVFLDLNMPVLNGWEFLEAIQSKSYSQLLKVIILTSSVNKNDKERAQKFNQVITFLEKPLTDKKLAELKNEKSFSKYF